MSSRKMKSTKPEDDRDSASKAAIPIAFLKMGKSSCPIVPTTSQGCL